MNLEDILMIKEFPDVFPKELLSLPPEREVYLTIEVLHGTTIISRLPYCMASTELKELKTQLHELLDKGFVQPSVSPLGAPVLYVKKKDGILLTTILYRRLPRTKLKSLATTPKTC